MNAINGQVRSQSRSNVLHGQGIPERLEAAIARYHTNRPNEGEIAFDDTLGRARKYT